MSRATRLLEHAVSTVTLGPIKSKKVLRRLDSIDAAAPGTAYFGILSGSFEMAHM
jgi:hypothetical protein